MTKRVYSLFVWDSPNTGREILHELSLPIARTRAKQYNHATIQGQQGYFEEYEQGEKVSWSAQ